MSFRGEKYDGDFFGGSVDVAERGDSFDYESKTGRNASSKRTARQVELIEPEESPFQESSDKDRYLITYADLITLLLGLFIILYAISNIDSSKYKSVVAAFDNYFGNDKLITTIPDKKTIITPKDKLSEELSKLIVQNNYSGSIQLEENERGIILHIMDKILFSPANADLNEASKTVLKKIADVIRNLPNDIRIEGFTDNTPINNSKFPSNWHLSSARALNTAWYLIRIEGISPDKVSIVGNGENQPIASNDSPESRARNRRVDIVILK